LNNLLVIFGVIGWLACAMILLGFAIHASENMTRDDGVKRSFLGCSVWIMTASGLFWAGIWKAMTW
jgi:membrane-bound ClpP family serine protease